MRKDKHTNGDDRKPRGAKPYGNSERKPFKRSDKPFGDKKRFGGSDSAPRSRRSEEGSAGENTYRKPAGYKKPFQRDRDDKPFENKRRFDNDRPSPRGRREEGGAGENSHHKPGGYKKPFQRDRDDKPFEGKRRFDNDRPAPRGKREEGSGENNYRKPGGYKKPFQKDDKSFGNKPYRKFDDADGGKPFEKKRSYRDDNNDAPDSDDRGVKKPFRKFDSANAGLPFERKPYEKKEYPSKRKPFKEGGSDRGKDKGKPAAFAKKTGRPKPIDESKTAFKTPHKYKREHEHDDEDDFVGTSATGKKRKRVEEFDFEDGATGPMPLNKYIAHSGECSRRDAAELVKQGKVKVNGELVTDPGYRVADTDLVTLVGKKLTPVKDMVYVLLNKPKGFITTTDDPQDRRTVMELVANAGVDRLFPIGRLDRNTTGLLLLTNDGDLAQKLSHPSYEIKKIYQVTLTKPLTKADFEKIVEGVELEDGMAKVDELSYLDSKNELGLQIHNGRNRIVRRIFESLGYEVEKLDRVMFAGLTKKNLPRSKWRLLTDKEVIMLKHFKS